jgi:hypothetical protein
MIDDYLVTLAAAGQSPLSIELRRGQLIVLAREIGCDPADVTAERLVAWFGDPSHNWSTEHRRSYRGAASRFFAWAYKTKRLPDYLGDELPGIDP